MKIGGDDDDTATFPLNHRLLPPQLRDQAVLSPFGKLLKMSDLGRVAHLGALVVLDTVAERLKLAEKGGLPVDIVQITDCSVGI